MHFKALSLLRLILFVILPVFLLDLQILLAQPKLDPKPPAKEFSVTVGDTDGNLLVTKNHNTKLVPASVLKLFTTVAALKKLDSNYTFSTTFWFKLKNNQASLVVVGSGDPLLNSENLYAILLQLKARGVLKIDNLIIDSSRFIDPITSKGERAYHSGTNALSINQNSREQFSCQKILNQPVESCSSFYRSVPSIDPYFAENFREIAGQVGISTGKVSYEKMWPQLFKPGSEYLLVYEHRSPSLEKIIFYLNHFSTNMIANQLVYALGQTDQVFSFQKGLEVLNQTIKQVGVQDSFEIYDGSGLSTKNRSSSMAVYNLLKIAINDPLIAPEFMSSLSIANKSGTLKSRKIKYPIHFRGKTGSLDGVTSLAGILVAKSGRKLLVSLLQNGVKDQNLSKQWEESFVEQLYNAY